MPSPATFRAEIPPHILLVREIPEEWFRKFRDPEEWILMISQAYDIINDDFIKENEELSKTWIGRLFRETIFHQYANELNIRLKELNPALWEKVDRLVNDYVIEIVHPGGKSPIRWPRTCPGCGEALPVAGMRGKYCDRCRTPQARVVRQRDTRLKKRMDRPPRSCEVCGTVISHRRAGARTCSPACRRALSRRSQVISPGPA